MGEFFSADPARAHAERMFLIFSPFWMALVASVVISKFILSSYIVAAYLNGMLATPSSCNQITRCFSAGMNGSRRNITWLSDFSFPSPAFYSRPNLCVRKNHHCVFIKGVPIFDCYTALIFIIGSCDESLLLATIFSSLFNLIAQIRVSH